MRGADREDPVLDRLRGVMRVGCSGARSEESSRWAATRAAAAASGITERVEKITSSSSLLDYWLGTAPRTSTGSGDHLARFETGDY